MTQLLVRGLNEATVRQLKDRARAHGRSVEAEHRTLLEEALGGPMTTQDWIDGLKGSVLAEVDFTRIRDPEDRMRDVEWP
jgi:antitoxin FitA